MNGWIGIDPGASGAIALINDDETHVWDWPGDERLLIKLLWPWDLEFKIQRVVLEYQQAMPKQGVVSMFKLGVNYGMWLAAVAGFNWPLKIVRPAEWKKGLGYPAGDYEASKAHSLTLARQRFPELADQLSRKKDNGRAEALLLAQIAKEGKL